MSTTAAAVQAGCVRRSAVHPGGRRRLPSDPVRVTVLAGGVGGARFLTGLRTLLGIDPDAPPGAGRHEITAVVNVGDDVWLHGLRITPDLDSCLYTLGGGVDAERGWGRADEGWRLTEELAAY